MHIERRCLQGAFRQDRRSAHIGKHEFARVVREEFVGLDYGRTHAHDAQRNLARAHKRRLLGRMARGLFFLSRTRKLPCGREPGKRLGIFIDEYEQTSSRRSKLNNRCTHVVGDIGELWLSRHNISHHGAERRSKRPRHAVHGILVEGLDNCLIKFSRCCTPVPGDSIIGFITRGAGVSIHRTDCENYLASRDNPETTGRWIRVSWAENTTDSYGTTLTLLSAQRSGLVMDVATALNTLNAKVRTLTARDVDSGRSTITITVEVHDLAELRTIMSRLSAVRGVIRFSRSGASDIAKATANTAELQAEHAKNAKKAKQEGKA